MLARGEWTGPILDEAFDAVVALRGVTWCCFVWTRAAGRREHERHTFPPILLSQILVAADWRLARACCGALRLRETGRDGLRDVGRLSLRVKWGDCW